MLTVQLPSKHLYVDQTLTRRNEYNTLPLMSANYTRWFKYDWDDLCVNKSQFVPVIFEPPCTLNMMLPTKGLSSSLGAKNGEANLSM
jgi:hypothetical protein